MQYTNVPKPIRATARALKYARKSALRLFGAQYPRNCTICGHTGRFFSYGYPLAADTICPGCLSLERHRALAICAGQELLFEGKELLHFAPEPSLTAFIRSKGVKSYKTCDLFKTDIDFASTSAISLFRISHSISSYAFTFWSTSRTIARELCTNLGDGMDQAADISLFAT